MIDFLKEILNFYMESNLYVKYSVGLGFLYLLKITLETIAAFFKVMHQGILLYRSAPKAAPTLIGVTITIGVVFLILEAKPYFKYSFSGEPHIMSKIKK